MSSGTHSVIGVLMSPGWIEFTRIPLGPQFQRGRLGQPPDSEFGCGVTVAGYGAGHPFDRRDVDDRSASRFLHGFHHRADAEKHARQIDVEDPLPLGDCVVLEGADVDDARVVHQHVDAAVLAEGGSHRRVPVFGFRDVKVQIADVVANLCRHRLALVVEDVAEHHLGALGHQRPHVRGAHPPRTPADECDLSRQPFCHCVSPVVSVGP